MSDLDAIRDAARAVSTALVERELASGLRVQRPRDPGLTHFRAASRTLLVAVEEGLVTIPPTDPHGCGTSVRHGQRDEEMGK